MVHAFRMHDENSLHRIQQPEAEPNRCNPYPAVWLKGSRVRIHIEIVFYGSTEKAKMQRIAGTVQQTD
jgi:hypothetical protein